MAIENGKRLNWRQSKRVHAYLVGRDGNVCQICFKPPDPSERLNVDHKDGDPRNQSPENWRLAHRACNTQARNGQKLGLALQPNARARETSLSDADTNVDSILQHTHTHTTPSTDSPTQPDPYTIGHATQRGLKAASEFDSLIEEIIRQQASGMISRRSLIGKARIEVGMSRQWATQRLDDLAEHGGLIRYIMFEQERHAILASTVVDNALETAEAAQWKGEIIDETQQETIRTLTPESGATGSETDEGRETGGHETSQDSQEENHMNPVVPTPPQPNGKHPVPTDGLYPVGYRCVFRPCRASYATLKDLRAHYERHPDHAEHVPQY